MADYISLKHRSRTRMRPLAWGLAGVLTLPAAAWASGRGPAAEPDANPAADAARVQTAIPEAPATAAPTTAARTDATADAMPARSVKADARMGYTASASHAVPVRARNAQRRAAPPGPDFLFGQPRVSIGIRGLWHRARSGSDFYDFTNELLFVPRSPEDDPKNPDHGLLNFDAPGIGFDFGFGVTSRIDVRIGVDYAASLNLSETRGFQGSDGLPIEQRTDLSQTDLRGELVFAVAPRGRAIGQYAWIPSRVVPYVGAGLSFVRYDLSQIGEFVDDLGIFEDAFTSKGWGPGVHLFGGADIRMTRHVFLNAEVRHVQSSAKLGDDFDRFEPLDLGGLRIGAGVRFVF